jgi:Mg/Co/Ni transporter MgtE
MTPALRSELERAITSASGKPFRIDHIRDVSGGCINRALVLGFAMFAAIMCSNTLGAAIPLVMKWLKVDPAVAAGPFITTAADIVTVLIYFNIAQAMIG